MVALMRVCLYLFSRHAGGHEQISTTPWGGGTKEAGEKYFVRICPYTELLYSNQRLPILTGRSSPNSLGDFLNLLPHIH